MKNNKDKEKFTIIVRIRPRIKQDLLSYKENDIQSVLENEGGNTVIIQRKNNEEKIFRFNHVFSPASQAQVYQKSSHLVEALFDGFNSTFLAYGQTGTGKTHTIFGHETIDPGYFTMAVEDIFKTIKKRINDRQFAVRVSFVEFYLDNIFDLLQQSNNRLQIKQSPEEGVHIKDLTQVSVKSAQQLLSCLKKAIKLRKTEETNVNKRSSRSHAVIQITILQRWNDCGQVKYLKGMLKIVDLAGSERVSKTQSNGNRLEQAKRINKQITTLGKCINLLAQAQKENKSLSTDLSNKFNFNKSHIPFRDSKITRFLSDSLEGKSKIILCVCISKFAIHIQESFSSLMFATQASTLKIDSKKNEVYVVKKSIEKVGSYETPLKNKSEHKQRNATNKQDFDKNTAGYMNNHGKVQTNRLNIPNGQKLLQKFKKQVLEIKEYLEKKEINTKNQSKETLQANLQAMNKIFGILRQNSSPSY